MRNDLIRNILAALGAVFLVIVVLSLLLSVIFGRGVAFDTGQVAVVGIRGVITDPEGITRKLDRYGDREDVKAVVVRINSPGGAVGPSQEIHRSITRLSEKKPVVASLGTTAASGGFYAAVAAQKVVANPGTITGSIGVIVKFINARELMDKVGVEGYTVKSGKFKDTGSPFREMTDSERELLSGVVNEVNSQFIDAVAEGRGLERARVEEIADGRILTGSQALELGLVDSLGDMKDAVDLVAGLAGIEGEPTVIYPRRSDFTFWDVVFGGGPDSLGRFADRLTGGLRGGFRIMYMTPGSA